MLASGPILASGTFWTGAAVAVTVVAIAVSIRLWALGSPRRLLVYNMDSDTALFSGDARQRAGADLEVTMGGRVVNDPHVVSFRVESRSRRDIVPDDFIEARPVTFEMAVPILKLLDSDVGGDSMPEIPLAIHGSNLTIGPSLIKSKQAIKVDLLTDGRVTVSCPRPALADVTVRQRPADSGPTPPGLKSAWRAVAFFAVIGAALVGAGKILHSRDMQANGGLLFFAALIMYPGSGVIALLINSYRGGWMRGPDMTSSEDPSPPRLSK